MKSAMTNRQLATPDWILDPNEKTVSPIGRRGPRQTRG